MCISLSSPDVVRGALNFQLVYEFITLCGKVVGKTGPQLYS